MGLRRRVERLEKTVGRRPGACPECGGNGRTTLTLLNPGEESPPGGCPACGRGTHISIRRPIGPDGKPVAGDLPYPFHRLAPIPSRRTSIMQGSRP